MIILRVAMNALPKKRKELLQTIEAISGSIRKQRGCSSHHVYQDIEDENALCLLEEWENQDDLENYLRSDRFAALLGAMDLLSERPAITFNQVSSTAGMELVEVVRAQATAEMVTGNLRLVIKIAKGFRGRRLSFSDLIQHGNIGLMKAVARFDHTRGNRFST
jgi:DNA-directed RNA polymerase sigma subunit (sigma70/sigma32)